MDKQNLIIFKLNFLYEIFKELEENINLKIHFAKNEKILNEKINNLESYIIITKKKITGYNSQFLIEKLPFKFFKLNEKLNVQFLKNQYNFKSELEIGKYKINFNSRELLENKRVLKLTEKEIDIINYLTKSEKVVSIEELQAKVWGYNSKLDTHTVETHIYRLRKKIYKIFNNQNFILSKKKGYKINIQ